MRAVWNWLEECSASSWRSPHARQFFVAMVLWSFSVGVVDAILGEIEGGMRVTAALVPVLPAAWAMWALVMYLRRSDELERRKYVEALTFAFVATFVIATVAGRLESVGEHVLGARDLAATMLVAVAFGYAVAAWRYR